MNTKRAFTIIELLLILFVISSLMGIVIFQFQGAQNRARTAENTKRAHDIINSAEQQIGLAVVDRGYPDKRDIVKWQRFLAILPEASAKNISTDSAIVPSGSDPQRLQYLTCRDETGEIKGIKVRFWNYSETRVDEIKTGDTEGAACQ